jgi:hypothetical protein
MGNFNIVSFDFFIAYRTVFLLPIALGEKHQCASNSFIKAQK